MKILGFVFGALGGFVAGTILTKSVVGGGIAGAIGAIIVPVIGGVVGKKAVESEADSLVGEGKSIIKTLFWWFVLLIIAAAALIFVASHR